MRADVVRVGLCLAHGRDSRRRGARALGGRAGARRPRGADARARRGHAAAARSSVAGRVRHRGGDAGIGRVPRLLERRAVRAAVRPDDGADRSRPVRFALTWPRPREGERQRAGDWRERHGCATRACVLVVVRAVCAAKRPDGVREYGGAVAEREGRVRAGRGRAQHVGGGAAGRARARTIARPAPGFGSGCRDGRSAAVRDRGRRRSR